MSPAYQANNQLQLLFLFRFYSMPECDLLRNKDTLYQFVSDAQHKKVFQKKIEKKLGNIILSD
jgi:hypothetical protein